VTPRPTITIRPEARQEQGLPCPHCRKPIAALRAWTWETLERIEKTLTDGFAGKLELYCRNSWIWDVKRLVGWKVRE